MLSRITLVAIACSLLATAQSVDAQNNRHATMLEELARNTPPLLRGVAPDSSETWLTLKKPCTLANHPDSIAIISAPIEQTGLTKSLSLWSWQVPDGLRSARWFVWRPLSLTLSEPDTLRARVRQALCAPTTGVAFVLESDGFVFGLDGASLDHVLSWDQRGSSLPSRAFVRSAAGNLEPAILVDEISSPPTSEAPRSISLIARADFEAEVSQRQKRAATDRVALIRAKHWTASMTKAVIDQTVLVGMTEEMVRLAWGQPSSINQTTTAGGSTEQWVYGNGSYVYLRNGRVSTIQTRR